MPAVFTTNHQATDAREQEELAAEHDAEYAEEEGQVSRWRRLPREAPTPKAQDDAAGRKWLW